MSSGPYDANRPAPPRRVYLAAPYTERETLAALAVALRAASVPIVSTWHDTPQPAHPTSGDLVRASMTNHRDLRSADAAVFVVHRGQPCETWVEFGAAFHRVHCLVLHHEGSRLPISTHTVERDTVPWWTGRKEQTWIVERIRSWYGTL